MLGWSHRAAGHGPIQGKYQLRAIDCYREELDGNICRCTGYHNIMKSVRAGAKAMEETASEPAPSPQAENEIGLGPTGSA